MTSIRRWLLLSLGVTAALIATIAYAEGPQEANVSVSGTSARTAADLGPGWKAIRCDVEVFFRTGNSAVVAVTTDMPIPAATARPVYMGNHNEKRLAFITSGGSGTCRIYPLDVGPNGIPPDTMTVNGAAITPSSITSTGTITGNNFVAAEDGAGECALTIATQTLACFSGNSTESLTFDGSEFDLTDDLNVSGDVLVTNLTFNGGGTPCLVRGGNTSVQTCEGDGFVSKSTLQVQASSDLWAGIKNTANGANCSGQSGAVCIEEDLAGSTSGTTGWTISGAGVAVLNTSMRIAFTTLGTCAAGVEGALRLDTASGVSTGAATRLCMCRSDGAAVYRWVNVITGNVSADATSCPA